MVFPDWPWPKPVLLKEIPKYNSMGLKVWDPRIYNEDYYNHMPIITPALPQQNSTFNVTRSSLAVMKEEIAKGLRVTQEIHNGNETWSTLFEPSHFFSKYKHYIVVKVSAKTSEQHKAWTGFVESKLRILVSSLDKNHKKSIELSHVHPKSHGSLHDSEGQFVTKWFVGMKFVKNQSKNKDGQQPLNVDLTGSIMNFKNFVTKKAKQCELCFKGIDIDVFIRTKETAHEISSAISHQEK